MKMTGHKTESVYRRYAIVSESDVREPGVRSWRRCGVCRRSGDLTSYIPGQFWQEW